MRTDAEIKREVMDQLYWDPGVDATKVAVTVANGVVTLAGYVPSAEAKNAAYDNAWTIAGLRSVVNRLEICYPATTLIPPSDEAIKTAVENALWCGAQILTYKIDVIVKNRWVTLTGTVDTYWRKQQAEETTAQVEGVLGVTNELGVVPTQKPQDEIIARKVINTLRHNTNVNIDKVTVTVNNGVVNVHAHPVSSQYLAE